MQGKAANVIMAANTTAEIALRLQGPGKKNKEVTVAIPKVAAAYDCKVVEEFGENEAGAVDVIISIGPRISGQALHDACIDFSGHFQQVQRCCYKE